VYAVEGHEHSGDFEGALDDRRRAERRLRDRRARPRRRAKRGVFAYVVMNGDSGKLQDALDLTLRRFAEFHNLEGAFGRRAIIEQAKGILMARNSIDADAAHQLLKTRSQHTCTKLSDVALAVTQAHLVLLRI
jgi:AmiR/NasT family two-component response regulator